MYTTCNASNPSICYKLTAHHTFGKWGGGLRENLVAWSILNWRWWFIGRGTYNAIMIQHCGLVSGSQHHHLRNILYLLYTKAKRSYHHYATRWTICVSLFRDGRLIQNRIYYRILLRLRLITNIHRLKYRKNKQSYVQQKSRIKCFTLPVFLMRRNINIYVAAAVYCISV